MGQFDPHLFPSKLPIDQRCRTDQIAWMNLISMPAAFARALAARAAAVVQTTTFRRRALRMAVQSAANRFRRGFIPRQINLPVLAGKSLSEDGLPFALWSGGNVISGCSKRKP